MDEKERVRQEVSNLRKDRYRPQPELEFLAKKKKNLGWKGKERVAEIKLCGRDRHQGGEGSFEPQ